MMWIKEVYPLEPYRILLKIHTGEQYTLDCSELMKSPLFAKIKDPEFFRTVHVDETGLICWDKVTDIEPEWLRVHMKPAAEQDFRDAMDGFPDE